MSPIRNPCAYARATGWLAVALAGLSACAHGQLNIPSGCRLAREQCTANPTGVYRLDFGPTSATSGVAGMRTAAAECGWRLTGNGGSGTVNNFASGCPGTPYPGSVLGSVGTCLDVWTTCSNPQFGPFSAFYDGGGSSFASLYYIVPPHIKAIRMKIKEMLPGGAVARVRYGPPSTTIPYHVAWNSTVCTDCPVIVTVVPQPGDHVLITEASIMAVYWIDMIVDPTLVTSDSVVEDCSGPAEVDPPSYFKCWVEGSAIARSESSLRGAGVFSSSCLCSRSASGCAAPNTPPFRSCMPPVGGYASMCNFCARGVASSLRPCDGTIHSANCDSNSLSCAPAVPRDCPNVPSGWYYSHDNPVRSTVFSDPIPNCGLQCGTPSACRPMPCKAGHRCRGGASATAIMEPCLAGSSSPPGSSQCNEAIGGLTVPPTRVLAANTSHVPLRPQFSVQLQPLDATECATAISTLGSLSNAPNCTSAIACGGICEGGGGCGTSSTIFNCQANPSSTPVSLYRKVCPTAQTAPAGMQPPTLLPGYTGYLATLASIDGNALPADPCLADWDGYDGGPFNYTIVGGSRNVAAFEIVLESTPLTDVCMGETTTVATLYARQPIDYSNWPLRSFVTIRSTDPLGLPVDQDIDILTPTVTAVPTQSPTAAPTAAPSSVPTLAPSAAPTHLPTAAPTLTPTTGTPSVRPTRDPTNRAICSARGVQTGSTCACEEGYAGNACQYSRELNCNGRVTPNDDGSCPCPEPAAAFTPQCECRNPILHGPNCSDLNALAAKAEEDAAYRGFLMIALYVWLAIVIVAVALSRTNLRAAFVAYVSFDWLTDVGFIAVSLQAARFTEQYTGSASDILTAAIVLLSIATITWLFEAYAMTFDSVDDPQYQYGQRKHVILHTVLVLVEDIPQLALQIIYFETVGLNPQREMIATLSLFFTLLGVVGSTTYLVWAGLMYFVHAQTEEEVAESARAKKAALVAKFTFFPRRRDGGDDDSAVKIGSSAKHGSMVVNQAYVPPEHHTTGHPGMQLAGSDLQPPATTTDEDFDGFDGSSADPRTATLTSVGPSGLTGTRCAHTSDRGQCKQQALPTSQLCPAHTCPKCGNGKPSNRKVCATCVPSELAV